MTFVWISGERIGTGMIVTAREEPHHYGTGSVEELRGPVFEHGAYDPDRTWARVRWDNGSGEDWLQARELALVDIKKLEEAKRP
jgi:hypothetical protein